MNKSLLISHPARLSTHTAKPSRSWVLTTAQIEQGSERGQSREKGRLFGELLEALLKHGKRKAIWSSKVGRERALFHSRACRKMARNGLAGNSKTDSKKVRSLQEQPVATMKGKSWLERTHHQSGCSAPLYSSEHVLVGTAHCHSKLLSRLLPAGDRSQFNPFWQVGGWWEATLSPQLLSSLAPWWGAFAYKVMTELALILYFNALTLWFCSETTATVCTLITVSIISGTFLTMKSQFVKLYRCSYFHPSEKHDAIYEYPKQMI